MLLHITLGEFLRKDRTEGNFGNLYQPSMIVGFVKREFCLYAPGMALHASVVIVPFDAVKIKI